MLSKKKAYELSLKGLLYFINPCDGIEYKADSAGAIVLKQWGKGIKFYTKD